MGLYVFKLPDVGEGTAEAEIVAWHVKVGDAVDEDQNLVDVATDKAIVEVSSPVAGRVIALHGEAGGMAPVGAPLVELEIDGAGNADKEHAAPDRNTVPASIADAPAAPPIGERPLASPAVRRRATELGIALNLVPGTGAAGRISHSDLDAYVAGGACARPPRPTRPQRDSVEEIRLIGLRRKIAEKMQESKRRIPHFSYVEEIDMTDLETLRVHLNGAKETEQPKLTVLPFLMRALVKVLPDFPQINARFDDEAGVIHRHAAVHIGIATQTANGLVVPVVRHAEALDLWQSATEIRRIVGAVRANKAAKDDLSGSTITISSLGALGGIAATPVINYPEVAIIGPNAIMERPVVRGGQIVVRKLMNLSSSFDHRVIDGHDAAEFVQKLKLLLEHPATLFMEQIPTHGV